MKVVDKSATWLWQRLTTENLKNDPRHGKRDAKRAEKVAYNRHYVRKRSTATPSRAIQGAEMGDFAKAATAPD